MSARADRNQAIDVLRGAAILAVLALHYGLTWHPWRAAPVLRFLDWGNLGVTVFFVVSGFLIAGHELQQGAGALDRIDFRRFYVRRIARLGPLLLAALAIILALGLAGIPPFASDGRHPRASLLEGAATVLTFSHNLFMQLRGYTNYCLDVYWSLSIEENFYLLFPLVCALLRGRGRVALLCAVLVVAGPVVRATHLGNDTVYLYGDLACFDAIAIGVLAALFADRWRAMPAAPLRALGIAVIAVTWWCGFDGWRAIWAFSLVALGSAAVLLGCRTRALAAGRGPVLRRLAPLAWMGRRSYELYLFHIVVLALMRDAVPGSRFPRATMPLALSGPWFCLFLAASCGLAALAAALGDPANRTIRRRFSSKATRPGSRSETAEAPPGLARG